MFLKFNLIFCIAIFITLRVLEKVYAEDGHCMPMPRRFKQAAFRKPRRLVWDVSAALATKIQNAVKFSKTVSLFMRFYIVHGFTYNSLGRTVFLKLWYAEVRRRGSFVY